MRYHVTVAGRTYEVELGAEGTSVDGRPVEADLVRVGDGPRRSLLLDGSSFGLDAIRRSAGVWSLHLRGRRHEVEVLDERTRAIREMTGGGAGPAGPKPIRAPMPGLVLKVEVGEGDVVEVGQGVVIVEAMKMENELRADAPGVVSRVRITEGETVEKDQVLIEIEARDPTGEGG